MFHLDFSSIDFNKHNFVRTTLEHLRSLLESLYKENLSLKSQLQQLKDEINRLKGQKGKPDIKKTPMKKTKSVFLLHSMKSSLLKPATMNWINAYD